MSEEEDGVQGASEVETPEQPLLVVRIFRERQRSNPLLLRSFPPFLLFTHLCLLHLLRLLKPLLPL